MMTAIVAVTFGLAAWAILWIVDRRTKRRRPQAPRYTAGVDFSSRYVAGEPLSAGDMIYVGADGRLRKAVPSKVDRKPDETIGMAIDPTTFVLPGDVRCHSFTTGRGPDEGSR